MMEDFFFAGGVPAVMRELLPLLHRDCLTVNGKTIEDNVARGAVLQPRRDPRVRAAAFLRKAARWCCAATCAPMARCSNRRRRRRTLCEHTGPAYVFESYQQMHDTIDSMDLPIDEDTVLVMKGCGPKGAPGFPEWGHIPMPKVLLERGVSDCVRISRCAHERHQLRHGGAARVARVGYRRTAGRGGDRRPDHAERGAAGVAPARLGGGDWRRDWRS